MSDEERVSQERDDERSWNRRAFLGAAAAAGAMLAACAEGAEGEAGSAAESATAAASPRQVPGPLQAPEGRVLKAGLVGCGGRGTGAAIDYLSAGPGLELTALGDVFEDRVESCRGHVKEQKGVEVADASVFVGFDAFQKVIESGVDIVLLATPPHFRPEHFRAAVEAGKHVFMEKPVAVDPTGIRSIMETARLADEKGLNVVTGTQRRHERSYIETYNRVAGGAIGRITAARCYWNQGQLWYKEREAGWSDMEWMIRDWVNWCWLSGDHIVEQHVHNIDVVNWFTGSHPVKAVGLGGRARRVTGDQYDSFSVDYELENGMHVASMCRQIDGCANNVSEYLVGSEGSTNCKDTIYDPSGNVVWKYGDEEGGEAPEDNSPYVQEHVDLVTAIRAGERINEAVNTATSTMVAIMGRISAYRGTETTWDDLMASEMRLGPDQYSMGSVDLEAAVPVPGTGDGV